MSGHNYQAVFFDLYGTLIDIRTDEWSDPAWDVLRETLLAQGVPFSDTAQLRARFDEMAASLMPGSDSYADPDVTPVYRDLLPAGRDSREQAERLAWTFRKASTLMIRLYPGAADLLRNLHESGFRVVLVSNAQASYTRPELDMLGLTPLFDDIVISSEVGVRKPSPRIFEVALQRCNLQPDQALMIGNDAKSDVGGAASVGIDAVYLHTEISPAEDAANCEQAVRSFEGADYDGVLHYVINH